MRLDLFRIFALLCAFAGTIVFRWRLVRPTTHGSARWGQPPRRFLRAPEPGGVSIGRTEQAWIDLEAALLSGIFAHTATLSAPTLLTAYRFITTQPQEVWIEQLLGSASPIAQEQANIFLQTQERMRGSILPVLAA